MSTTHPRERGHPGECQIGDWVVARSMPRWSILERLHSYCPPAHPAPSTAADTPLIHTALTTLFEQSSIIDDHGMKRIIWVRKE